MAMAAMSAISRAARRFCPGIPVYDDVNAAGSAILP